MGEVLTLPVSPKGPDLGGHGCWGDIRPGQACHSSNIQTEQELTEIHLNVLELQTQGGYKDLPPKNQHSQDGTGLIVSGTIINAQGRCAGLSDWTCTGTLFPTAYFTETAWNPVWWGFAVSGNVGALGDRLGGWLGGCACRAAYVGL